jgi:transposase
MILLSSSAAGEASMDPADEKRRALRAARALNPRPEAVADPAFRRGDPFFDARDLVQVKYEMLRRVHVDGQSVTQVAAAFGFSRPSFYAAQAAWQAGGLAGLLPARPGPRGAHKLTPPVVAFLHERRAHQPQLRPGDLARLVRERFGLVLHPRSIERALARHRQGGRRAPA